MEGQAESLVKLVKQREKESACKVLSFVSGKGGVGKTAVATSLAYILATDFKKRVLLLDADVGLGNVHLLLGLSLEKNLKAVLKGAPIEQVIQKAKGFDVVLGFSGIDSVEELDSYEASNLLIQLERLLGRYDYVLIDNSAGINRYTVGFSRWASATYVVTTPEPTALTDAYAFIKSVYKLYGYASFKVVVNMVRSKREGFDTFERLNASAVKFLGIPLKFAGVVPYSERFSRSLAGGRLLVEEFPSDPFSQELRKVAQLEVGELIPTERREGLLRRLLNFIFEGV
ncbi:nucleotide-binding protein [Thermovibrio ammonificans]